MWLNPQFSADLVAFTEEILDGKLYFLCSERWLDFNYPWPMPSYMILRDLKECMTSKKKQYAMKFLPAWNRWKYAKLNWSFFQKSQPDNLKNYQTAKTVVFNLCRFRETIQNYEQS